jgi:Na+/melibiose symporter-like transporter
LVARGTGQPDGSGYPPADGVSQQARTEHLTALRPALPDAEVERIWLRGSIFLVGPMGLALVAVAVATYLMAIGHQGAAWTVYVIAGIVTVVMPLILWRHDRRLRRMLADSQSSY